MKRIILALIATLALILALGSMGAYANDTIGLGRLAIQLGIAVLVEWLTLSRLNA